MERDGKSEGRGDGDVDRWREGGDGDRKGEEEMGLRDYFLSAQCTLITVIPQSLCSYSLKQLMNTQHCNPELGR